MQQEKFQQVINQRNHDIGGGVTFAIGQIANTGLLVGAVSRADHGEAVVLLASDSGNDDGLVEVPVEKVEEVAADERHPQEVVFTLDPKHLYSEQVPATLMSRIGRLLTDDAPIELVAPEHVRVPLRTKIASLHRNYWKQRSPAVPRSEPARLGDRIIQPLQ